MRRKAGIACIVLGAALIISALFFLISNTAQDAAAGKSAQTVIEQLERKLPESGAQQGQDAFEQSYEMKVVEIDGYGYIGYLTIPSLELELPVMDDWDYQRLKIAPCRQFGSTKSDDLVIAGHNYSRHFGNLKLLTTGDEVFFTDTEGEVNVYEVATVDILPPTAVEEVKNGGYDLTLYTCTYGGRERVTVRCMRAQN